MGLLNGGGDPRVAVDFHGPAVEVERVTRGVSLDQVNDFREPVDSLGRGVESDSDSFVLVREPPRAEADFEAAFREQVEGRGLFGENGRRRVSVASAAMAMAGTAASSWIG